MTNSERLKQFWAEVKAGTRPAPKRTTSGVVRRVTKKPFGHYRRPIVVTLVPGTDERDDLLTTRLKGTREIYVARIADVHRMMALWHAGKVSAAKRAARRDGIPWRQAKRELARQNRIC